MKQHIKPLECKRVRWQPAGRALAMWRISLKQSACIQGGGSSNPFGMGNRPSEAYQYSACCMVFVPKYFANEMEDRAIEVFSIIAIFALASCFGLAF
jgi:hypothetical protein